MHIFIIGATGRNGNLVLQDALSRNHTVTALVRNPDSLTKHANLTTIKGTPFSQVDLENALITPRSPDVIITTLNQRRVTESPFAAPAAESPPDLLASGMKTLLAAIAAKPGPAVKIVVNSSQGVKDSWRSMNFPSKMIFKHAAGMRIALEDHTQLDTILRRSGVKFVMPRPCRLVEGPAKEVRVWPDDGAGSPWMSSVTRDSVAKWLVDAAESSKWDGQAPVITN
ncbi:hypothetical protein G7046_g9402 [Stylonectria norvegica]|nr:hypothetical protein G7046_g9402 [Stylonectria norvegica]